MLSPTELLRRAGILLLLWVAGIYMRAPILIAAPLGERIRDDLGFGQTALGALTTLPVFMLGLGALPAAWLIGRYGARNTLVASVLLTGVASMLRALAPDIAVLLGLTAAMGLGIAAMQPALPALVGRWCPSFVALGAAIYINGMMLGEFVGAGLTLPLLLPAVGGDWRSALAWFSVPAIALSPLLLGPRLHGKRPTQRTRGLPAFDDRLLWRFGLLLGATAATFFGMNAYMGVLLERKGLGDDLATMLFAFNLTQLVTSIVLVFAVRHVLRLPRLLALTCLAHIIGLLGFLLADGLALLYPAAVLLSLTAALQLIVLTALPPLLRDADSAGRLAAGMLAVGYILGFAAPIAAGAAADALGSPYAVVAVFLAFNTAVLPLAWATRTDPDY
ncbi:cyanate transport protein CynX [Salinisphaera shabanensis T35B1]